MAPCWDGASSKVATEAITFMKGQSASLAGMDPFSDSRYQVLRAIKWATDGSKSDCWQSAADCTSVGTGACNPQYAKACCAGCAGWSSESAKK